MAAADHPDPRHPTDYPAAQPGHPDLQHPHTEGFITVEEVAAVSDRALIDIRGIGPGSINTIRDALAAARTPSWPEDTLVTLSGPQVRELTSLLATLTVYAEARGKSDVVRRAHAFIADALSRPPNA